MTDTKPADDRLLTVEERLALLEARLTPGPLALVPPITIGSLTNVPVPGSQIAAQWAQDVTGIALHRFATGTQLQAWAAPAGAYAVTVDNGVLYRRVGAAWARYTPYTASQGGAGIAMGVAGPGTFPIATISIPQDPGHRTVVISCILRVDKYQPAAPLTVQLLADGNGVGQYDIPAENDTSPGGGAMHTYHCNMTCHYNTTPSLATEVKLQLVSTAATFTFQVPVATSTNRLDVIAVPRGV